MSEACPSERLRGAALAAAVDEAAGAAAGVLSAAASVGAECIVVPLEMLAAAALCAFSSMRSLPSITAERKAARGGGVSERDSSQEQRVSL